MTHDEAMKRLNQNMLEIHHIIDSGANYVRLQILLNKEWNKALELAAEEMNKLAEDSDPMFKIAFKAAYVSILKHKIPDHS